LWAYPFETSGAIEHLIVLPDITGDQVPDIASASTSGVVTLLDGAASKPKLPCVYGDADCDSVATLADALISIQLLSGIRSLAGDDPTTFCLLGDANHDGRVSIDDIIVILRILAGASIP